MSAQDTCFVISPFGEPFDTYFVHVIKPAIESCSLYAIRGDSLYRPTTIVDDIWSGIQDAQLLVAELTGRNPNVFYELGLAHALSKPVILLAEAIDDVPFDLRAIRVLLYDKAHPEWGTLLRQSLTKAIREVLDNPNSAIPLTFKTPVRVNPPEESEMLIRLEALEAAVQRFTVQRQPMEFAYPEEEEAETLSRLFEVGQRVLHPKFGEGTVLEVDGYGTDERARINFDHAGLKWIATHFARMRGMLKKVVS